MTKPTSGTWQPDIFNGAGIVHEPGKDRTDNLRREAFAHFEQCDHDVEEAPTVEANVVTFHRPVGGWPRLAELLARSIALGGDPFGPQSDDVEYGRPCMFCGNRAAVCRCDS